MKCPADCRLYGFLDTAYLGVRDPADLVAELITGGVDLIQLRAKPWSWEDTIALAHRILPITRAAGIPLIINDHIELARRLNADGVHLGQEDAAFMSVATARKRLGPGRLVGLSTHSLLQAKAAVDQQPDYIGIGPIFPTGTKPNVASIGLETLRQVVEAVPLPAFAIGGISLQRIPEILRAGGSQVAIVSAILCAPDVMAAARQFKQALAHPGDK